MSPRFPPSSLLPNKMYAGIEIKVTGCVSTLLLVSLSLACAAVLADLK